MLVADASAVVDALLGTSGEETSLVLGSDEVAAPHLIDVEVLSALRRLGQHGAVHGDRVQDALSDFSELPLTRFPHEPFLERIWALRANVTAYDATYIALAEALGIPLVTCDGGQAVAAESTAEVRLLPPQM